DHPNEPIPGPTARGLPYLSVTGQPETAYPGPVIRRQGANRYPTHGILALVSGCLVVVLAVVDTDLHVDEILAPVPVHAQAEVHYRHITAPLQRHLALHTIVPESLFPIEPWGVDLAELECQRALLRGERGVGVLQPVRQRAVGVAVNVSRDARSEAGR